MSSTESADIPGSDESDQAAPVAAETARPAGAEPPARADGDLASDGEAAERAEQQRLEAMVPVDTEQLERADEAIGTAKSTATAALDPNRD